MRRVALLIESSRSYGRGLLRGIAQYVRTHENWSLRHQELSIDASPPLWLRDWDGNGILARIETLKMADVIRSLGIPTVDLRSSHKVAGIPRVDTNDRAVVRLAVDHLRDRGFRRFAFCGFQRTDYSVRRLTFFLERVRGLGLDAEVYESPGARRPTTAGAELRGMLDETGVGRWLCGLEKPVGLMACNDIRAQQVLDACKRADVDVPDEVAVIGVDNDDVICPLCDPPLSSVEPDTERIGYEAASLLESMMNKETHPAGTTLIPPSGVVTRRSTNILPVEDRVAASAYRFIREHACEGISVSDVLQAVSVSRRSLERRLRHHFHRTPLQLIAEFKLQRIKRLLQETDYTLERISRLTGFNYVEHMAVVFKHKTGLPPGKYRTRQGAVDH